MNNLIKFAAAGLLAFGFIPSASAAGGAALADLGSLESGAIPEPAAPSAAVPGQDAANLDLFSYFGYGKISEAAAMPTEKGIKGAAKPSVISIKLESIRNVYLKPALVFTTGAGTKVYLSGTKAANCPDGGNSCEEADKFFLMLTTGKGSYFVRAKDVINWGILYSGSQTVVIDGEKYVVKIRANASTPADSKVEVAGPKGVALNVTLKQLGDAIALKGVDVKLSKTYKLAYGNEVVQGPQGAKFTAKMLVLLIPFPVVDASSYSILNASDIKPAGVTFPSIEKDYGFRLNSGVLDIYRL